MKKVRIKKLPKKAHGGPTGGASDGLRRFLEGKKTHDQGLNQFSEPDFEVNKTLTSVPDGQGNIEAEGGETAVVPGQGGIPEHYNIEGPRHGSGGVNLNLDKGSFIFSDNKKDMKIKDKEILAEFGMSVPKKGKVKGKTPAKIAKKYDINEYKKILMDPNADKLEKETAERMIQNYNVKLGKLALVQESMKGFPQGMPEIANPYLQSIGQSPSAGQAEELGTQAAYGGEMSKRFPGLKAKNGGTVFTGAFWDSILKNGGTVDLPKYPDGGDVETKNAKTSEVPEKYKDPKYDAGNPNFDPTLLQAGDYVKTADGGWKKVTYVPENITYQGEDFGSAFNSDQDIANSYAFLEQSFNDPEVKSAFAQKTREALLNKEYYKGKSGGYSEMYDEDFVNNMTDDELVNHFLTGQKRNYAIQSYGIDPKDFRDSDGKIRKDLPQEKKISMMV